MNNKSLKLECKCFNKFKNQSKAIRTIPNVWGVSTHCGLASTVIKFAVWLVVCGGGKAVGLLVWDQHQLCRDVYSCKELSNFKRRTTEMVRCKWTLGTILGGFTLSILEKDKRGNMDGTKTGKMWKEKRQRGKVWAMMESKIHWKDWSSLLGFQFDVKVRASYTIQKIRREKCID